MLPMGRIWGTAPDERLLYFPCDRFIGTFDDSYYRGISIQANPKTIFRWLCQMRMAPYSYDWIDNFGRKSPRSLTPGLEELAIGQKVMSIFELIDFVPNEQITLRIKEKLTLKIFGDPIVSYMIIPKSDRNSRLLVKLILRPPSGLLGRLLRFIFSWGDLIMMRRQLLNFKELSEQMPESV